MNLNPDSTDVESAEDEETDDISPVDAALMQDRVDEFADFANIRVDSVPDDPKPMVESPDRVKKEAPKSGPPTLEEWQDFIGRIVLRTMTDLFLSMALRDFEDELTEREREMIRLTKEDLNEMSAPLASLAHKSKFAKKRGRALIAAADSSEAVVALVIWMRRVNKIASKHRKMRQPEPSTIPGYVEGQTNGNSRSDDGTGQDFGNQGFGGFYNPGTG